MRRKLNCRVLHIVAKGCIVRILFSAWVFLKLSWLLSQFSISLLEKNSFHSYLRDNVIKIAKTVDGLNKSETNTIQEQDPYSGL